jgi:hypothetical protein
VPLTTGYLASAGTLYTKGTGGSRMTSLCAGALADSADPVGDINAFKHLATIPIAVLGIPCAWRFTCCFLFIELTKLLQSKETFRSLLRSDVGEAIPFSTLHNRSQVYKKLTGRKLANAQLNLEKYDLAFCAMFQL